MLSAVLRGLAENGGLFSVVFVLTLASVFAMDFAIRWIRLLAREEKKGSGPVTARSSPTPPPPSSSSSSSSSSASSSGAASASASASASAPRGGTMSDEELQDELMSACQRKDTAEVAMLLEAGGSLESLREVFGFSALHIAASEDAPELARVVLEKSTTKSGDVDYIMCHDRDDDGIPGFSGGKMTPIFLAVMKGHLKVARLLIEAGGNVNIGWGKKYSPYYFDTATPLAELTYFDTATPLAELTWWRSEGYKDVTAAAKLLLENGADPNLLGRFGESPLYKAIEKSRLDLVDLLLLHGADPNLRSSTVNKTLPLVLARESGKVEIVRSLLRAGACATDPAPPAPPPLALALVTLTSSSSTTRAAAGAAPMP